MPGDSRSTIRIFIALWPEDTVRSQLNQLAGQLATNCEGKRIRLENLHLTLSFIGQVDKNVIPRLCQALSAIKQPAFDLSLDQVYFWKREGVVAAGMKHCPTELTFFVQDIRQILSTSNIQYDTREFVPHVTLVRNAKHRRLPDSIPAIDWRVTRWSLAQSRSTPYGVAYHLLANWALEPGNLDEYHRI